MVSGEHVAIDSSGKERPTASPANVLDCNERSSTCSMGIHSSLGTMTVRHTVEAAGAFDESLAWRAGLGPVGPRLSRTGCQIADISEPVMAYRSHAEQMTQDPARREGLARRAQQHCRGAPAPTDIEGGAARGVCLGLSAGVRREAGQRMAASADIELSGDVVSAASGR